MAGAVGTKKIRDKTSAAKGADSPVVTEKTSEAPAPRKGRLEAPRDRVDVAPARVKVVRNGSGKALPVPAAVLTALDASIGSQFEVQLVGDDVLYHRLSADGEVTTLGSGADHVFLPSEVAFVGSARSAALFDDWQF